MYRATFFALLSVVLGCVGPQGDRGVQGTPGASCTLTRDEGTSSVIVTCPDGTSTVLNDGSDGEAGSSCAVSRDAVAQTSLIVCDDGTTALVPDGSPGAAGEPGADGTSCTAIRNAGSASTLISCEDGTTAVVNDGSGCSVEREEPGLSVITCDDGTVAVVADGADGSTCTSSREALSGSVVISCSDGSTATLLDGSSCSVVRDAGGATATVTCEDGTSAVIADGTDGASCTVSRTGAATTILCSDGTSATVTDGADGTSCTVEEAIDGAIVRCSDGTSVPLADGVDGDDCSAARDEATGTTTVTCGGVVAAVIRDGEPGAQGLSALVSTSVEPAGANCRRGGTRVDVGVDEDRDGTLDGIEIDSTTFICGSDGPCEVVHGDVIIHNSIELDLYAGCTEITGQLIIAPAAGPAPGVVTLEPLSSLRRVGSNLTIVNHAPLTNLEGLRSLEEVGGDFDLANNVGLANLDGLRSLQRVQGNLSILNSAALNSFAGLSALETVGGVVTFASAFAATSLTELTSLRSAGGFAVQDTNISSMAFPALRSVPGPFRVMRVPALPDGQAQVVRFQLLAPFPTSTTICGTLGGPACP